MEFNLKINLNNASYKDNPEELQENLENIIVKIKWGDTTGIVFDSNGNKTGHWNIEEECGK